MSGNRRQIDIVTDVRSWPGENDIRSKALHREGGRGR